MTPRCWPGSMRWQAVCSENRLYWGISTRGALALRGAKGNHTPMAILSDKWIRAQAQNAGMIEPFVEAQRREGCMSYGLSSYGYDARVADERSEEHTSELQSLMRLSDAVVCLKK